MAGRAEQQTQILQEQLEAWTDMRKFVQSKRENVSASGLLHYAQALQLAINGERQALYDITRAEANAYIENLGAD